MLSCGVAALVAGAAPAFASAPACSALPNIAQLEIERGTGVETVRSNPATLNVQELLDVVLAPAIQSLSLVSGERSAVPVTLTNGGNGREAFTIHGAITDGDAAIEGFAIDADGDGRFDAARDTRIDESNITGLVSAGQSLPLLVLVRGGNAGTAAQLTVTARAATGSGTPGSGFAGKGDGGCDAVVGATSAASSASVRLSVGAGSDPGQVQLIKTQDFWAPNGRSEPVHGATVIYTIEARFDGTAPVNAVRIADNVPGGTRYLPGSLSLDGVALTDAADGDAGSFDGAAVHFSLGDVPASARRRVQFRVIIQ